MKKVVFIFFLLVIMLSSACIVAGAEDRLIIDFVLAGNTYRYIEMPIIADNHLIEEQIYSHQLNSSHRVRARLVGEMIAKGESSTYAVQYYYPMLHKFIVQLIIKVRVLPTDSKVKFFPQGTRMFAISQEKDGYHINVDSLYRSLLTALENNQQKVFLNKVVDLPSLSKADNEAGTALISRFSTNFSSSAEGRKSNIALALKNINGKVLDANEQFSFNKVVGKRTVKRGFCEANIIIGGSFVKGIGGGVCQVSTTLYNAVIRAGVKVDEVQCHSLPIGYVPPSFDAMVNSGSSDLRFTNVSQMPLYIRCFTRDDNAIIEMYGKTLPFTITTESYVTAIIPPPKEYSRVIDTACEHTLGQPSGTGVVVLSPKEGKRSEGYLVYRDYNGMIINKEKIRTDTYNAQKGKIAIAP